MVFKQSGISGVWSSFSKRITNLTSNSLVNKNDNENL